MLVFTVEKGDTLLLHFADNMWSHDCIDYIE